MHHAINEYQPRLDVQHFLWPVYYYIVLYYLRRSSCILECNVAVYISDFPWGLIYGQARTPSVCFALLHHLCSNCSTLHRVPASGWSLTQLACFSWAFTHVNRVTRRIFRRYIWLVMRLASGCWSGAVLTGGHEDTHTRYSPNLTGVLFRGTVNSLLSSRAFIKANSVK